MSMLDAYRQEIRAQLDAKCLLRRDQAARALFITDYPRRAAQTNTAKQNLLALGYTVTEDKGLWLLDLSPARYERDFAALAPQPHAPLSPEMRALCRSLRVITPPPVQNQPLQYLRLTLLRLDEKKADKLFGELSAAAAMLKRTHAPLPAAAANIIEENALKEAALC